METVDAVVSMNNPVSFNGYTLFQSSYRLEPRRAISFLSVSRDPYQLLVFAGYVITMVGMVVVLATRIGEMRRLRRLAVAGPPADASESPRELKS